jgi:hypothetical protein
MQPESTPLPDPELLLDPEPELLPLEPVLDPEPELLPLEPLLDPDPELLPPPEPEPLAPSPASE